MKKYLAAIMAFCLCFASIPAYAAESDSAVSPSVEEGTIVYQDDDITIVQTPLSADDNGAVMPAATNSSDYNSAWVSSSKSDSFPVNTSKSGTIGITLKVESSSNSSFAYISVKKPNGSYFKNDVYVDPTTGGGEGAQYTMYLASSGTYTIEYTAYTTVGMRIMCWLY